MRLLQNKKGSEPSPFSDPATAFDANVRQTIRGNEMNPTIRIGVIIALSLAMSTSVDARRHRHHHRLAENSFTQTYPKLPGHVTLNNDGKTSWVTDANENIARRSGRAQRREVSRERKVRLASIDTTEPFQSAGEPLKGKAAPMGHAVEIGSGIVVSHKTGARARVGVAYAARFQAYINDLEEKYGARVIFMGGIRPGRCSPGHEHPCGKALDVCQLRRGVVDHRCNLPSRAVIVSVAQAHGLFEGGRWCDSDYGHVQVDVTGSCGRNLYAAIERFKEANKR